MGPLLLKVGPMVIKVGPLMLKVGPVVLTVGPLGWQVKQAPASQGPPRERHNPVCVPVSGGSEVRPSSLLKSFRQKTFKNRINHLVTTMHEELSCERHNPVCVPVSGGSEVLHTPRAEEHERESAGQR